MRKIVSVLAAVLFFSLFSAAGCEKNAAQKNEVKGASVAEKTGEKIAVLETDKGVIKFRFFEA
ncbi:MAG TPA: hypothetical protein P5511_10085, partial [Candidatus Goldiibacteriota bacterium]|nr:hypothetical protein [Candidatus Goldiibacteriota bacterium]